MRCRQGVEPVKVASRLTRCFFVWLTCGSNMILASGAAAWCNSFWLTAYQPAPYKTYADCSDAAWATADFTIPGAGEEIHVDCWCQNNLTPLWKDMYAGDPTWNAAVDCCAGTVWDNMCSLDCNPDCTDARTQECKTKCPPLCLATGYESLVDGASCDCASCWDKVKCLFAHAETETTSGSSMRVCDTQAFERTQAAANWIACVSGYPHSTRWEQTQASATCACANDVVTALNSTHCCGSPDYSHICANDVRSQCDDLAAHCGTWEAQECLTECAQKCNHISIMSPECENHCYKKDSLCAKYQKCPPVAKQHNYVCDDGTTQPTNGGCCSRSDFNFQTRDNVWCPRFCSSDKVYWLISSQRYECDCGGCPLDMAGIHNAWHAELKLEIDKRYETGYERILERLSIPETRRAELASTYQSMVESVSREHVYSPSAKPQEFPQSAEDVATEYRSRLEMEAMTIWNEENPTLVGQNPSLAGVWGDAWSSSSGSGSGDGSTPVNVGGSGNGDNTNSIIIAIGETNGGGVSNQKKAAADDGFTSWLFGFALMLTSTLVLCFICVGIERFARRQRDVSRTADQDARRTAPVTETLVVGQPVLNSAGGFEALQGTANANIPTGMIIEDKNLGRSGDAGIVRGQDAAGNPNIIFPPPGPPGGAGCTEQVNNLINNMNMMNATATTANGVGEGGSSSTGGRDGTASSSASVGGGDDTSANGPAAGTHVSPNTRVPRTTDARINVGIAVEEPPSAPAYNNFFNAGSSTQQQHGGSASAQGRGIMATTRIGSAVGPPSAAPQMITPGPASRALQAPQPTPDTSFHTVRQNARGRGRSRGARPISSSSGGGGGLRV
ncbi:unnamed protein product [Amoebophrya sp. A25]|nr:unnamed protein product [Amoebophrya sp. A25]|eukprot:GSA25T00022755001.1